MESEIRHRILVVDDEPDITEILEYNLKKEGYEVQIATNGKEAIAKAKNFLPNLILMDIMMPKMDGVEASRHLRSMPETADTYIIFLTARVEEYSEVAAFDVGADDYIIKPIKPRALLSRISAIFRRNAKQQQEKKLDNTNKVAVRGLVIDRRSYTVEQNSETIVLPKKEFELLFFLAKHPNQVFTRDALLQNVWGADVYVLARTVDVHIRKVREKIGEGYITTVKGVGYKLEDK